MNRNLYIIAGCNGAGKTTASYTILPEMLGCREFVNADEIARGLSPFQPEKAAIEAGRIMLNRIAELITKGVSFAFETTLATKSYKHTINEAKRANYEVTLVFFFLQSIELAKNRVQARVAAGGHNIEDRVIERRYKSGIKNLFEIYIPLCDRVLIADNSKGTPKIFAKKDYNKELAIIDKSKFNLLKMNSL
jgi:predicted ABC-type ATPase